MTDRSHGPRSEWRPSSRSKVPAHTPPPKNQDEGRLQMLLEGALAAKSIQDTKTEDPKDRKYKQLLEEISQAEGTFAHTLKEIELRDRRISSLEDDLERSERRNKLLRDQLELAQGVHGLVWYHWSGIPRRAQHGRRWEEQKGLTRGPL